MKSQLKKDVQAALFENVVSSNDDMMRSLKQMDRLITLHQEVLNKLETSSNKNILNKVLDEITNQLDNTEELFLEQLNSHDLQTLNENAYGEGWMIKSQLYSIAKNAMRLHKIVNEKEDFEDWVQAKLTIVDDYMATIAHFIEYRKMTVGNFDMDDKHQYSESPIEDEDLSSYNDQIPLI